MWISNLAIRRPIVVIVAMIVLSLAGVLALRGLETDEFPDVQPPMVTVMVPFPGAAPSQVERELLRPLEDRIRSTSGLKRLQGTAGDGYALLLVEYQFNRTSAEALQETRDAVSAARGDLPSESEEPVIERFSETDLPVMSLAVAGGGDPLALGADARRIAKALRVVDGVAQVRVIGDAVPSVSVEVDPARLRAAGASLPSLVALLESQNISLPVGRLEASASEWALRFEGRPQTAREFENLAIKAPEGRLVRLRDVADVRIAARDQRTAARVNGATAVTLDIRKRRGASATTVSDALHEKLAELRPTLPANRTVEVIQDGGVRTSHAVADVQKTLIEGALLTVLVVFVFLNSWRSTVITGLALPVSVMASFVAVWMFGFKLETHSLLGLSLAIGILIDDAIVVRDNIVRHVEMGKDHVTAAREGTAEIGLAVLATTAAIVVVFLPVAFMDGLAGQYFKPFALTIVAAVLVSLFVSFSLDPMLSAYWPDPHLAPEQRGFVGRQLARFNHWFDGLATGYRGVVHWALTHRLLTLGVAVASLVLAVMAPALGLVESEFVPEDDRGELAIQVETPPGTALPVTLERAETAAKLARALPEVRTTYTTVGSGDEDVTKAQVLVLLHPRATRTRSARQVAALLREQTSQLDGATFAPAEVGIEGNQKPIQLLVRGATADSLPAIAASLASRIRQIPGAADVTLSVRPGQPSLNVRMERGLASVLGVTPGDLAGSLRAAFAGVEAGNWIDDQGDLRKVIVRFPEALRGELASVDRLPLVAGPSGAAVQFSQLASLTRDSVATKIEHENGEATVTITANVFGKPLGTVSSAITAELNATPLPPGVSVGFAGDVKEQQEIFGNIITALVVAVVAMYLVLVLQFNSWIEPMAILTSLPLSAIGVVAGLALTGKTINIMSMIGIILLAGVVAKNAILLIEFAKQLQERGLSLVDALVTAGAERLRPIVMTTVALVAGMLPVALGNGEGAQFRAPLGVAVIGGTITSTLLTLLVVPVIYAILVEARGRLARLAIRPATSAPVASVTHAAQTVQ